MPNLLTLPSLEFAGVVAGAIAVFVVALVCVGEAVCEIRALPKSQREYRQ